MTRGPVLSRGWAKHLSWMLTVLFLGVLTCVPWRAIVVKESTTTRLTIPGTSLTGTSGVRELYREALQKPMTPERYAQYTWAIRRVPHQTNRLLATSLIGNMLDRMVSDARVRGGTKAVAVMEVEIDHYLHSVPGVGGGFTKVTNFCFTWFLRILVVYLLFVPVAAMILMLRTLTELSARQSWQSLVYGVKHLIGAALVWPGALVFYDPKHTWLEAVYELGLQVDDPDRPQEAWRYGQVQPSKRYVETSGEQFVWQRPLTVWRAVCALLFSKEHWQAYSANQKAHAIYLCLVAGISLLMGASKVAFGEEKKSENPLTGVILFSYFSSAGGEPAQDGFLLFRGGYLAAYGYTGNAPMLEAAVDTGSFRIGTLQSTVGPFTNLQGGRIGTFGLNGFATTAIGSGQLSMPWQVKTGSNGGLGVSAPDTRLTWKLSKQVRAGFGSVLFANPHQHSSFLVGGLFELRVLGGNCTFDVRAGPWLTGSSSDIWEVRAGLTKMF